MNDLELTVTPTDQPTTQLAGLSIRTRNQDEMTEGAGKIPGLWASFYQNIAPKLAADTAVYGVYTNYESDHTGYFDVSAAVAPANLSGQSSELEALEIRAGTYLKFTPTSSSEDPIQQVISLWQRVWAHFADEACAHKRAYTSDFELYHPDKSVELFIAIV